MTLHSTRGPPGTEGSTPGPAVTPPTLTPNHGKVSKAACEPGRGRAPLEKPLNSKMERTLSARFCSPLKACVSSQGGCAARYLRGQFHVHYSHPALPAASAGGAAVQQGRLQRHRVGPGSTRVGGGGGGCWVRHGAEASSRRRGDTCSGRPPSILAWPAVYLTLVISFGALNNERVAGRFRGGAKVITGPKTCSIS